MLILPASSLRIDFHFPGKQRFPSSKCVRGPLLLQAGLLRCLLGSAASLPPGTPDLVFLSLMPLELSTLTEHVFDTTSCLLAQSCRRNVV